ncbi:hypothetical protein FOMG_19134 [Fusarium oxysporum f. sp. melonis 26406]|uniref:Carboxylic ester hydrolase n=1 Tax=Fusarium oxysporum f. sp. melonis 26406 TaxID=1089452 RepID=W9YYA2_FUSOX|nr:hypothetical protein FOMG_19134 [Fusarium oxysporum f. sp. melonis 26406]
MGNTLSVHQENDHEVKLGGSRGSIRGLQLDSKARRYLGIPYALPPVGDLRWRRPQPLPDSYSYSESDGTPFDATKFGPVCLQPQYSPHIKINIPGQVYSEDCLRLNIWTPVEDIGTGLLPVYVWIHGGWFQIGDPSHEKKMDATELLSTGNFKAVFVAVGYRLNVFGFLSGSALDVEGQESGNYGLWDQRLALEWIYDNVSSFGGDPHNITVSGRSAGAYSVEAQTLYDFRKQPSSYPKALFRKLVMISNAIPAQPKTSEECQPQFDELCEHFNVPRGVSDSKKMELLRAIDGRKLTDAVMKLNNHTFRPVTDGVFILQGLNYYIQDGSFAREFKERGMKLFIGEALNEETLYGATNSPSPDAAALHRQVANYYAPDTTRRVLEHYKLPETVKKDDWQAIFGRIVADGQVCAPSRILADSLFRHGVPVADVWRYQFAYRLSFITEEMAPSRFGIAHAMDRPLWNFSIRHGPTPEERILMQDWINGLAAFVAGDASYDYGTSRPNEHKVITGDGWLEVQVDARWAELLEVGKVFSGKSSRSNLDD